MASESPNLGQWGTISFRSPWGTWEERFPVDDRIPIEDSDRYMQELVINRCALFYDGSESYRIAPLHYSVKVRGSKARPGPRAGRSPAAGD